jgi:hypothetical protein
MVRLGGRGLTTPADLADKAALLRLRALAATPASRRLRSPSAPPSRAGSAVRDQDQELRDLPHRGGTDHRAHGVARPGTTGATTRSSTPPRCDPVGGTAPYFHDGRFATLEDLLASPDHAMGATLHLGHADASRWRATWRRCERAGFVSLLGLATLSQACGGTPTFDEPAAACAGRADPHARAASMVDPRATLFRAHRRVGGGRPRRHPDHP